MLFEELPVCADLALRCGEDVGVTVDRTVFLSTWAKMLAGGIAHIFGAFKDGELVGAIGGIVVPGLHDGAITGQEAFWYVSPAARGIAGALLFRAFVRAVKAAGAQRMTFGLGPASPNLAGFYRRIGLEPVEIHYQGSI